MKEYDYAVFVGRFQPFHSGHQEVVLRALERAETLIMVIGSASEYRTTRNPFTFDERVRMITATIGRGLSSRIRFVGIPDYPYNNDKWIGAVQSAVFNTINQTWISSSTSVALVGMKKDATSFYLNMFPNWDSIDVEHQNTLDASEVRKVLFDSNLRAIDITNRMMSVEGVDGIKKILDEIDPVDKKLLLKNWKHESEYEAKWGKGPHVTVDSIVVQAGHILLVQRGGDYGKGLWALPGGFIERKETVFQAAVRELYEETCIKVPEKVLGGCLEKVQVFDEPYRDLRGRVITHAHYFRLGDVGKMPKVKGADDAQLARWFSISEFLTMQEKMFSDHYYMITNMLNL